MRHLVKVRAYDDVPPEEFYLPVSLEEYRQLWETITGYFQRKEFDTWRALMRLWSAGDHVFLLLFISSAGRHAWSEFRGEPHFWHPVHIEMGRLIQFGQPDGTSIDDTLIIGARGLGKSTHFDVDDIRHKLVDANHASAIFSLTRDLATKHLNTIATEIDSNDILREIWPDRFWRDAEERRSAGVVSWGAEKGYTIKRTSARPEPSFGAYSFEYQLPAGMHFDMRRYDDIEADRTVNSELSSKTIEDRWVSSQNLSSSRRQRRVTGTYYSASGLMVRLETDYQLKTWLFAGEEPTTDPVPAVERAPMGGKAANGFTIPELWRRLKDAGGAEQSEDGIWRKTSNQAALVDYGRQTRCDPIAGEATRLSVDEIGYYEGEGREHLQGAHVVVCADCSVGMGDPTAIWAWMLTKEKEFWWVDGEKRVVTPSERKHLLHEVCQRLINFGAIVVQLRLEQFGQAQYVQDQEEYWAAMPSFPAPRIVKCNDNRSPGRGEGKVHRIYERWQPQLSGGRIFFPKRMMRKDERGVTIDLVHYFKTFELGKFPSPKIDNMLDAGGLIWEDPARVGPLPWPTVDRWKTRRKEERPKHYATAGML
jgi:hypothetical protein